MGKLGKMSTHRGVVPKVLCTAPLIAAIALALYVTFGKTGGKVKSEGKGAAISPARTAPKSIAGTPRGASAILAREIITSANLVS